MARQYGAFEYEVLETDPPQRIPTTNIYRKLWTKLEEMQSEKWYKVAVKGDDGLTGEALALDLKRKKDRIRASLSGFDLRYFRKHGFHINTTYSGTEEDVKSGIGFVYFIKLPDGKVAAEYI